MSHIHKIDRNLSVSDGQSVSVELGGKVGSAGADVVHAGMLEKRVASQLLNADLYTHLNDPNNVAGKY